LMVNGWWLNFKLCDCLCSIPALNTHSSSLNEEPAYPHKYCTHDLDAVCLQGIAVNEIAVAPTNLTATFFSDRIEEIDNVTSSAMYTALLSEGCLNSTGYLVENPR